MQPCTRFALSVLLFAVTACGGTQKAEAKPPQVAVTMDAARQTALAKVPGEVQKEELEEEDGKWVYSFEIKSAAAPDQVQEIDVDANNGAIVKVEAED